MSKSFSKPSTEQQESLEQDLRSARRKLEKLQGEIHFSSLIDKATDARSDLPEVKSELQRLRSRGYAFRGDLETSLQDMESKIDDVIDELRRSASRRSSSLQDQVDDVRRTASSINGVSGKHAGRIESLESEVRSLTNSVKNAKDNLESISEPILKQYKEVKGKVKDLHWTVDQFESATFQMTPEERPVAVALVTWQDAPGGDEPEGMLLLTDHRMYFEQKEERVTKRKFMFFKAESENLHKLLLNEPIGHLQSSEDSTKGWVMKEQILTFSWSSAADAPSETTFKVNSGTAKDWDEVIELLRTGDLSTYEASTASNTAGDVVGSAPPVASGHQVRWPENCQSCQAPLTPPVKGQTAIVCEFCGTSHAVEFVTA